MLTFKDVSMAIDHRRPIVIGNWKMNGSRASIDSLLRSLKTGCEHVEHAELVILPPFVYLEQCEQALMQTQISWGAQDVSEYEKGAYTGEISAAMLLDFHCLYSLVGHSERRILLGESNELVARKFHAALEQGLRPILCVGETEKERDNSQTIEVIEAQLAAVFHLTHNLQALQQAVIAYEPVWAIGTGKVATPEQAEQIHAEIRDYIKGRDPELAQVIRIIYGGSVNAANARSLFEMPNIDGALVGGASLQAEQLIEIGKQCNRSF